MSRKLPSFQQLIKYMLKSADTKYIYSNNLYTYSLEDINEITKEFLQNYEFLKKQKNSNSLYHEIISITKSSLDTEEQKEKLFEIVAEYTKIRAGKNLVYGCLHEGKDNLHFHLMISSNELGQEKNHRLTKLQFDQIKKNLEDYVLRQYPELEQKQIINKEKKQGYSSQKEFELKKRTGKITKKESIQVRLVNIFNSVSNKEQFFRELENNNIQIYTRGKNIGFVDLNDETRRKYRLNKLGLSEEFNKMSEILSRDLAEKQSKTHKTQATKTSETTSPGQAQKEHESDREQGHTEEAKFDYQHSRPAGDSSPAEAEKPMTKEQKAYEELKAMRQKRNSQAKQKKH